MTRQEVASLMSFIEQLFFYIAKRWMRKRKEQPTIMIDFHIRNSKIIRLLMLKEEEKDII